MFLGLSINAVKAWRLCSHVADCCCTVEGIGAYLVTEVLWWLMRCAK